MASSNRGTSPIPIPVDTVEVTLHDVDEKLARAFDDDTCVSMLTYSIAIFHLFFNHAFISNLLNLRENLLISFLQGRDLLSAMVTTRLWELQCRIDDLEKENEVGINCFLSVKHQINFQYHF